MAQQTPGDCRAWKATDRPGEWLAIGKPLPEFEFMSVRNSTRHWQEQMQEHFVIAAISPGQPQLEAKWHTRGQSYASGAGWLMNINAGDGHSTHAVNVPADFDVVKFSPQVMREAAENSERHGFLFRSPSCRDPLVFASIAKLICAVAQGSELLEVEAALAEAVSSVLEHLAEAPPKTGVRSNPVRDFRLRRVRDRLHETLSENLRLDELALLGETSKYRLCHNFTEAFGVPIYQYRIGCRLAAARQRVLNGEPHKTIASDLGFSDEPHFSRAFKRQSGLSPGAWRDHYRRNSGYQRQGPSTSVIMGK